MSRIECQGCGTVLAVPSTVSEGSELTCAECGLIIVNVATARAFRWAQLDAYTKEHGASRANLWGGVLGSAVWIPIFCAVAATKGEAEPLLISALSIPYVALLVHLFRRRARTPAPVWLLHLWTGLGAYGIYLFLLFALVPEYFRIFELVGGAQPPPVVFGIGGLGLLAFGLIGVSRYRRKAARLPRVQGTPPAQT